MKECVIQGYLMELLIFDEKGRLVNKKEFLLDADNTNVIYYCETHLGYEPTYGSIEDDLKECRVAASNGDLCKDYSSADSSFYDSYEDECNDSSHDESKDSHDEFLI